MKRSQFSFSLPGALSLLSVACLSSSNGGPAAVSDGGLLGPDSGAGCNSEILSRCVYSDGTCAEYSGPSVSDAGDPFDCAETAGAVFSFGQACVRTGTEGSCVEPSGITTINGTRCQFFLTTWIPNGYDSGVPGQTCARASGTFVP
jgi:hypothetical protein